MDEEYKNQSIESIINGLVKWQQSFVEDINQNFAGKSFLNAEVSAAMIKSHTSDIKFLLDACLALAYRIQKIEAKK